MKRERAAAIVVHDNQLLVMHRVRDGQEFYVFPGGGVEENETPEQAVVREVDEETSIEVVFKHLVFILEHDNGDIHRYFLCEYKSGTPALREGTNEYESNKEPGNNYDPQWLPLDQVEKVTLYPEEAAKAFSDGLKHGFPNASTVINAIAH